MKLLLTHVKAFGRNLAVSVKPTETREDAIIRKLERDGFTKVRFPSAESLDLDVPASGRVFAIVSGAEVSIDYTERSTRNNLTKTQRRGQ